MNICLTGFFRNPFYNTVERMKISDLDKKALRVEFAELMKINNIVALNQFKTIYMSYTSEFFLSEQDAILFSDIIHDRFGVKINPICIPYSDDVFPLVDFTDFKDMISQARQFLNSPEAKNKKDHFKELEAAGNKAKFDIHNALRKPIPTNIHNLKVLSIDFEYDQNKDFKISECGLSTYFNGETVYEHYIIEGNYEHKKNYNNQFQFNFGTSKIVSLDKMLTVISERLKSSNCIVAHDISAEHLILNHYGINFLLMEHLTSLDTQHIYSSNYDVKKLSLAVLLENLDINYEYLHNAGNDAAYTLKALLKMATPVSTVRNQDEGQLPLFATAS